MPATISTPAKLDTVLRVADRVDRLKISRRSLYRLIAAGDFPRPDRMAGKVPLWAETTVACWMAGGRA